MSLDHILLGILRKPGSGYEIKAAFDQVFNHFWQAQQSQIYRTLKRLEAQGCLVSRIEPSDQGPDRRVYRITDKGRAKLREWLAGAPMVGEDRHTYLAQVFFMDELGDTAQTLRFFRELKDLLAERRETLKAIERHWSSEDSRYPDFPHEDAEFYPQLTLDLGIMKTRTLVQWADRCIRRLEKRMEKRDERDAV